MVGELIRLVNDTNLSWATVGYMVASLHDRGCCRLRCSSYADHALQGQPWLGVVMGRSAAGC